MKALGAGNGKGMGAVKIREQAKRLASKTVKDQMKEFQSFAVMADWENRWTTMDPEYEIRQLRVFQQLVRGGFIYRKHKPVYWSISSQTALAEAELEYKDDHQSMAAYIKYPIIDWSSLEDLEIQGPLFAAIWTTTPWTLPANKAIAVHEDLTYCVLQLENYGLVVAKPRLEELSAFLPFAKVVREVPGAQLVGLQYHNKLQGKSATPQPILHADFVTADSGTGLVHLAPGHGQEDYDACSKIGIEAFAPITDEGYFTNEAFPEDPDRLTSAPSILEGGSQAVLDIIVDDVLKTHKLKHKYPYDWRTKKPVVSRATAQWFADVGSIKAGALEALKSVHCVPEAGRNRLENFIKGRSEWCISRQRAWGVPIPALYDLAGDAVMTLESVDHIISVIQERGLQAWFSDGPQDPAWVAPSLQGNYRRGTDTMDVWFDSGSSWTETPQQADVYLEGSDQHRGWFQSSLLTYVASQSSDKTADTTMSSPALFNREARLAPFRTLITHGFTLDDQGKKMSKSLGNTISPSQVMDGTLLPPVKSKGKGPPKADALGPDALRLWAASCVFTSDMSIGPSILQPVHSALIKYRTMLKMLTGSLHESSRSVPLTKLDHIAFVQLQDTMHSVFASFESFEFHRGTQIINRWVSTELSAFYLESLKDRLYCGDGGGIIEPIFIGLLRMLAPITPILVEEAWDHRPQWMIEDRYVTVPRPGRNFHPADRSSSLEHPARQIYTSPLIDPSRLRMDGDAIRKDWEVLFEIRLAVKLALESAREAKDLGSSLQARVIIETQDERTLACLNKYHDELDSLFVVSTAEINSALPPFDVDKLWHHEQDFNLGDSNGRVHVLPPLQEKCSRCWRYLAHEQEGLCQRCDDVVASIGSPADA